MTSEPEIYVKTGATNDEIAVFDCTISDPDDVIKEGVVGYVSKGVVNDAVVVSDGEYSKGGADVVTRVKCPIETRDENTTF